MMFNCEHLSKCIEIADYYGEENQLIQLAEECGELSTACLHRRRVRDDDTLRNLVEEIADVLIMIEQIRVMENIRGEKIIKAIEAKLDRQIRRIRYDD